MIFRTQPERKGIGGDSLLLVVESQIANLTLGPFFDYNLCFRYPNESYDPILDIYVPRAFQRYKERLNPMSFDPCNRFLKIWESIRTSIPKVGAHFGVWRFIPSHSPTVPGAWDVTPGLPSWPTTLQALALVMSPRLRLRQLTTFPPTKCKKHNENYYLLLFHQHWVFGQVNKKH